MQAGARITHVLVLVLLSIKLSFRSPLCLASSGALCLKFSSISQCLSDMPNIYYCTETHLSFFARTSRFCLDIPGKFGYFSQSGLVCHAPFVRCHVQPFSWYISDNREDSYTPLLLSEHSKETVYLCLPALHSHPKRTQPGSGRPGTTGHPNLSSSLRPENPFHPFSNFQRTSSSAARHWYGVDRSLLFSTNRVPINTLCSSIRLARKIVAVS